MVTKILVQSWGFGCGLVLLLMWCLMPGLVLVLLKSRSDSDGRAVSCGFSSICSKFNKVLCL